MAEKHDPRGPGSSAGCPLMACVPWAHTWAPRGLLPAAATCASPSALYSLQEKFFVAWAKIKTMSCVLTFPDRDGRMEVANTIQKHRQQRGEDVPMVTPPNRGAGLLGNKNVSSECSALRLSVSRKLYILNSVSISFPLILRRKFTRFMGSDWVKTPNSKCVLSQNFVTVYVSDLSVCKYHGT